MARWWWLGPWLHCPYLCLPRHITTDCLHASQSSCFPEKLWIQCAPSWLCLYHLSDFFTVISWTHNYITAIVLYITIQSHRFSLFCTWQQCLYVQLHNLVVHRIFICGSYLILAWSVGTTNCRAKWTIPWKHTISCELSVCYNSNEMDMRGNGI